MRKNNVAQQKLEFTREHYFEKFLPLSQTGTIIQGRLPILQKCNKLGVGSRWFYHEAGPGVPDIYKHSVRIKCKFLILFLHNFPGN